MVGLVVTVIEGTETVGVVTGVLVGAVVGEAVGDTVGVTVGVGVIFPSQETESSAAFLPNEYKAREKSSVSTIPSWFRSASLSPSTWPIFPLITERS